MVRLKVAARQQAKIDAARFQFQCGAIKRQYYCFQRKNLVYFNSNVVRLKDKELMILYLQITKFQFQCGAIKSRLFQKYKLLTIN